MTYADSKEQVNLAPATWIGLGSLALGIITAVLGVGWVIQGRLTTLELQQVSHERRLNDGDARDKELRIEILSELRLLRAEIKDSK